MTILYSTLAELYHEMYANMINYEEYFQKYHQILNKFNFKNILELACGTGLLGIQFLKADYKYLGLDLYEEMIEISHRIFPNLDTRQGDMRSFNLNKKFDAILITGRGFSYLIKNDEILQCFLHIQRHLIPNGIIVFDSFAAAYIFGNFKSKDLRNLNLQEKKITRTSKLIPNLQTGWTWDCYWHYSINEMGKINEYDDESTLRAFTKDELQLFLSMCGFNVLNFTVDNETLWTTAQLTKNPRNMLGDKFSNK